MSDSIRKVIFEPGFFVDFRYEEFWMPAWISSVEGEAVSLMFQPSSTIEPAFVEVDFASCQPVFTSSSSIKESFFMHQFFDSVRKLGAVERVIASLGQLWAKAETSEEMSFQLYACIIPLLSSAPSHFQSLLLCVDLFAEIAVDFLRTLLAATNGVIRPFKSSVVDLLWPEFLNWVPRLFQSLARVDLQAVISALEKSSYFQCIFDLLAAECCEPRWVQKLAELSLISISNRKDLRFQLIAAYERHIKADRLPALWSAGTDNCRFEFLYPLESMHHQDPLPFMMFFQALITTLLSSHTEGMQKTAAYLLRNALNSEKPHGEFVLKMKDIVKKLASFALCASAGADISEIFAHLLNRATLTSMLEDAGDAVSNFGQPAILLPMIEKKDWRSLTLLADRGFAFSMLQCNEESLQLLIYLAIGRSIPVALFQRLMDIQKIPLIEAYYLILRRYSKHDRMMILHALSPSHESVLKNLRKLPRGRDEVGFMLEAYAVFNPRIEGLWVLERINISGRIPKGLLMCVLLEFAYPVRR